MKTTSPLFEAFLKCPTKCHLRSLGETGSGIEYADWARSQDESYQREAVWRLQEAVPEAERITGTSATKNLKTAKWRLAAVVRFIPNVAIPIIVLPQFAASPEQPIDPACAEAFPVLGELRLWLLPNLNEQVDVPEKYGRTLALTLTLSPREREDRSPSSRMT